LLRRAPEGGVVPYDFRRPTKLSRDHARALQMSYETFARRLTTLLTSGLRQICQVSLVAIEHHSYEEYIATLDPMTVLSVLDIDPLPGTAVMALSVPTALACVDHMLGGPGGDQPTRQLTDIEAGLLRGLIEQMLGVLQYASESTTGMKPTLRNIEYNPQFVQAAGASDGMIVISFDMRVGSQVCVTTLCLPFASILPRLSVGRERATTAAERLAHEHSATQVRRALGSVPVEVSVTFDSIELTPAQIGRLEPGDVISLNHRVTSPLKIESAGTTFAHALAGRQGSRLAGLVVTPQGKKNS
jgi:flagellar motor switch protein FliM